MTLAATPVVGPVYREARMLTRWVALDGLPRVAVRRAARRGDPQARLIIDASLRDDANPVWEQIRARGPVVRAAVSAVTADHKLCHEVLRSDGFRVVSMGQ